MVSGMVHFFHLSNSQKPPLDIHLCHIQSWLKLTFQVRLVEFAVLEEQVVYPTLKTIYMYICKLLYTGNNVCS